MTRTIILTTLVAATLMTGLLVGSIPTTIAAGPSAPCPPDGKTVIVVINGVQMGPFDIDSYSTHTEKKKKNNTFMFTHEVDGVLSGKMLAALQNGDTVDIHITVCKNSLSEFGAKIHTVWLTGGTITSIDETSDDSDDVDDFPKEKIKGKFDKIEKMTEVPPTPPPVD